MNITTDLRLRVFDSKSCTSWHYVIVPEKLYQPELGEYHTYGVQITTPEHTDILHDISACKKTAAHIVTLLNRYQVSPIHLYDVITDML